MWGVGGVYVWGVWGAVLLLAASSYLACDMPAALYGIHVPDKGCDPSIYRLAIRLPILMIQPWQKLLD